MKTVKFTAYPDGYICREPGDQSGEYVNAEKAKVLLTALERICHVVNHQTFTCAVSGVDDGCPKCIANAAIRDFQRAAEQPVNSRE